jgi:Protein of unknown function (DUF3078)/Protein of unknown function, DUF481
MKTLIILLIIVGGTNAAYAQVLDSLAPPNSDTVEVMPNWKLKATYGLNGTQSSFVNWSAGGRNNISILGNIDASAKYEKKKVKWDTDLGLALGGLQYIGKGETEGVQKTDDRIDVSTSFGYKMKEHWYVSILAGFKTQFIDGYNYPNDSSRVSKFMAPGYVNVALGIDYSPTENFSIFISPLAPKFTFVQDRTLADAGAFGVEPAIFDEITGNLKIAGEKFRSEIGAYIKIKYDQDLAENISLKSKVELFSNYVDRPENIDVNAEILLNFKVNSWLSTSLVLNLIYDHDIDILDSNGGFGPRTQFKSVLGLGVSYTMKNYKKS